eukprot:3405205-Prymnesium_polylepis.1
MRHRRRAGRARAAVGAVRAVFTGIIYRAGTSVVAEPVRGVGARVAAQRCGLQLAGPRRQPPRCGRLGIVHHRRFMLRVALRRGQPPRSSRRRLARQRRRP